MGVIDELNGILKWVITAMLVFFLIVFLLAVFFDFSIVNALASIWNGIKSVFYWFLDFFSGSEDFNTVFKA